MRTVVTRSLKRWGLLALLSLVVYGAGWGVGQVWRARNEIAQQQPLIIRAPANLRPFAE